MGVNAYQLLWIKFAIWAFLVIWLIGWAITWGFTAARSLGIHHGPRWYVFMAVVELVSWPWILGAEVKHVLIAIVARRR